jgi:hypothetical protein
VGVNWDDVKHVRRLTIDAVFNVRDAWPTVLIVFKMCLARVDGSHGYVPFRSRFRLSGSERASRSREEPGRGEKPRPLIGQLDG